MKNILYVCHLLFISLLVKESREETCKTHNTQFQNLYSVIQEPFKLPLLNYFIGESIQYSASDLPTTYQIEQITPSLQGTPFSQTNVVGMAVAVNSGDPNLPLNQYGVLTYNDTYYSIYGASMLTQNKSQTINLNQYVNSVPTKPTASETQYCFGLSIVDKDILVSCVISNATSSQTSEVFYVTGTGSFVGKPTTIKGTQIISSTLSNVTGKTQVVQVNGQYYIAQILTGVNSTGNTQSVYSYYSLDLTKKTVTNHKFNLLSDKNNQYVDLFVSTSGIQFLLTSNYLILNNEQIPISQAQSLSVFELQVEPEYWMYLIAVAVPDGVFITDDYFVNSRFLYAPVVRSEYVNVFIDPYYVAIATKSGVSVYPSYQNHVNKGYALYSDSNGIVGSAYNVLSHTLTVISNTGSQYIYQLTNPFIVGQSFTAQNNFVFVQQSNSGSQTPCSVIFVISVVPKTSAANIEATTSGVEMTYYVGIPYPAVFTASQFFQGPALTMTIETTSPGPNSGLYTTQYLDIGKTAPLPAPVTYSENFIRSFGWTAQEIDPFNPSLDIQEQLFQVVQTNLGEIALLQVDPFTKKYKLIAEYTLLINEDIVQFSLGMNGQDYAIGALFANGSIVIVDNNKQYKTYTPAAGSFVSQIEIMDDYAYLVVETYEDDEGTLTDEIASSALYVYDYQSTVATEMQQVAKVSNVVQVSQKLNAYGQLLFLNEVNQIVIGKLINSAFVDYVNVSTPLTATLPNNPDLIPQLELTDDGMYFITSTAIYFMPRQLFLNADSQTIDLPWITIPTYSFTIPTPIMATSSLTHLYVTVQGANANNYLFVYSNPENLMNVLYFGKPIPANYAWLSVVGTKSFDFGTLGVINAAGEAAGDFILYPELYVAVNTTYLSSFATPNCTLQGKSLIFSSKQNQKTVQTNFEVIDLGKSLVYLNTSDRNITLLHSSIIQVDVRDYFLGNIYNLKVSPVFETFNDELVERFDIIYQAPLTNLTQGKTLFLNSTTTSAVRWYQDAGINPWTVIVNNTQVYFTAYLFNLLNVYNEIQYSKVINLTQEQSLGPDVTCPYIYVDEGLSVPVVICDSPSQKSLNFYAYNITSGNDSFVQIGTYQIAELSTQNITSIECLLSSVLIIKMTTSTTNQYQFLTFLIRSTFNGTKYTFNLYSLGNPMYGDSTMTPFALQDLSPYTIMPPINPIELYGFINVKQDTGDTPSNVLQVLTVSVSVSNKWSIVDATNNTIQEISIQNLLREYNIQPTGNLMKLITVIGQSRQLFTNTYVPLVISTVGTSFQIDLVFSQRSGQLINVKFNCFYQGIAQYSPNNAVGGNGMFVPYYRIGDSVYILNYGQALGHCYNQNIMTTLEVFNQTDFNGTTLNEVTQFQLLTSYTTPMIFITFANQTSNFILATQNLYLWFIPGMNSVSLVTPQQYTVQLIVNVSVTSCNLEDNQNYLSQQLYFNYVGYDSSTFQRRKHWEQFIWGGIMLVIIGGVLGYLCYNSRPQAYDY